MDKTLDAVASIHRLLIGVALAIFIVGVSLHHPNDVYDAATSEIQTLETAIGAASEQVNSAYTTIYGTSDLKVAARAWLRQRHAAQRDMSINVVPGGDLSVPDARQDPLVTLDAQVRWADRAYRFLDTPFLLCAVDRAHVSRALDAVFPTAKLTAVQLNVYLRGPPTASGANRHFSCEVELQHEVRLGRVTGLRSTVLDLPTSVIEVTQVKPWIDLEIAGTLKANGLGDYEDLYGLHIPAMRQLWAEIGGRPPDAALAFLKQRRDDEAEKSKTKIDILGQSLSGTRTIVLASLVEFCLMVYLLALLVRVRADLAGHEAAVSAATFFGLLSSRIGQVVIVSTLVFPLGVACFILVGVLPSFQAEWVGPLWIVGWAARWLLIGAFAVTDALLIWELRRIAAGLRSATTPAAPGLTGG